ncbi:riboflavin synthase, partial [bacterium]|nr:riboflavin synthase [bacterium]
MFTGIIYITASFISLSSSSSFNELKVSAPDFKSGKLGESIAINGICLTLTNINNDILSFDVSQETIARTNLKLNRSGDILNMERSLKVGEDISGHFVYGHVDCIGKLINKYSHPSNIIFRFQTKVDDKYLVEKGSISINGVSLTISKIISKGLFEVSVIPATLKNTNLNILKNGDTVNIEYDMLMKYIV